MALDDFMPTIETALHNDEDDDEDGDYEPPAGDGGENGDGNESEFGDGLVETEISEIIFTNWTEEF